MSLYRFNVLRRETVERTYECARCGVRGVATVRARGESGWRRKRIWDDEQIDVARENAQIDLQRDADRIMSLMHCPGCGERAPRAILWSAVRGIWYSALILVGVLGILWVDGIVRVPGWLAPTGLALGAALALYVEGRRWREAARGERAIADVRPGPPDKTLPKAVARERPPAPLAPLHTAAPDRGEGEPPPADGPRLLR